jgi:hypothetical protein
MSDFSNWQRGLAEGTLTADQMAVLKEMVDSGQVESVETAAKMLDWQDSVIDPPEHMYGF